jgi:hypothetical protein
VADDEIKPVGSAELAALKSQAQAALLREIIARTADGHGASALVAAEALAWLTSPGQSHGPSPK